MAKQDANIKPYAGSRVLQHQGRGNKSFHPTPHHTTKFTGRRDDLKGLILNTGGNIYEDYPRAMH